MKDLIKKTLRESTNEEVGGRYDLNSSEAANEFKYELTDLINKYVGLGGTNDAGTSNDNRMYLYKNLDRIVNQTFPPSSLRMGSHGSEYYTNRPDEMVDFLQSIGITDFELKSVR